MEYERWYHEELLEQQRHVVDGFQIHGGGGNGGSDDGDSDANDSKSDDSKNDEDYDLDGDPAERSSAAEALRLGHTFRNSVFDFGHTCKCYVCDLSDLIESFSSHIAQRRKARKAFMCKS